MVIFFIKPDTSDFCECAFKNYQGNKRPTGYDGHLSIKDFTYFLSEWFMFAYQQAYHRIFNKKDHTSFYILILPASFL